MNDLIEKMIDVLLSRYFKIVTMFKNIFEY